MSRSNTSNSRERIVILPPEYPFRPLTPIEIFLAWIVSGLDIDPEIRGFRVAFPGCTRRRWIDWQRFNRVVNKTCQRAFAIFRGFLFCLFLLLLLVRLLTPFVCPCFGGRETCSPSFCFSDGRIMVVVRTVVRRSFRNLKKLLAIAGNF